MFGFFEQCIDLYCELAKVGRSSVKIAKIPSIDDSQIKAEDFETEGVFSKDAMKVIMKVIYGARLV